MFACGRHGCGMFDFGYTHLTMLRNAPNNLTRTCFAKPTLPQYTGICMVAAATIASALGPRNYVCGDGGRLTAPFECEALGGPHCICHCTKCCTYHCTF